MYTTAQLAALTGITPRTVRLWRQKGLLPAPIGRGKGARFTDQHKTVIEKILAAKAANKQLRDLALDLQARYPHAFGRT